MASKPLERLVRLRLTILLLASACALCASTGAAAYPWPLRPFNVQHPVRANFGDPRTIFEASLFQNGIAGPGAFSFHNGIDISAPDGTAVYPVVSGVAKILDAEAISVTTDDSRVFQYEHIVPAVVDGQKVIAKKTIVGHVKKAAGHVHLTEIRGFHVWNPLAAGGIAPYRDTLKPRVMSIQFRPPTSPLSEVGPLAVCGTVAIVAEAYDTPQVRVSGTFSGFPVAPALLTWSMRRFGGAVYQPESIAADFRTTLRPPSDFWDVYARGTYQNAPRFGTRQFSLMPGRYLYTLTPALDTRTLPNGVYIVSARASDIRGHSALLSQRFTVLNRAGSETGCESAPPKG